MRAGKSTFLKEILYEAIQESITSTLSRFMSMYASESMLPDWVQRAKPLSILSLGKRNLDDINECLFLHDHVSKKRCINEVDIGTNNDHSLRSLVNSAYGNKDVSSTFMNNDDVELSTPVMGTQTFSMSKVPVVVRITVGAQNNTGMSMPIQDVRGGSMT
uniref:Uncharacterized protein n=1 Tax=Tanacetum cinerariifolium TaxID=118510 RepID=A0A6L2J1K2_TANCI|nr:hypothetical protein [Tanacetum cinerariifolium]